MSWFFDPVTSCWRYVGHNGELFGRIERRERTFHWIAYSIPICDGFMESLENSKAVVEKVVMGMRKGY